MCPRKPSLAFANSRLSEFTFHFLKRCFGALASRAGHLKYKTLRVRRTRIFFFLLKIRHTGGHDLQFLCSRLGSAVFFAGSGSCGYKHLSRAAHNVRTREPCSALGGLPRGAEQRAPVLPRRRVHSLCAAPAASSPPALSEGGAAEPLPWQGAAPLRPF